MLLFLKLIRRPFNHFRKIKIVSCILLIFGAFMVWLCVSVIFWPVADAEKRSDLIICLGGNVQARQKRSFKLYNEKYGPKLFLTNQSPNYFLKNGVSVSDIYITRVPKNTFEEARYSRRFMEKRKMDSALVVSDWWHLRRVRWSYETVFKGTGMEIRYIPAQPEAVEFGYCLRAHRIKLIFEEMVKLLGYWVRY